MKTVSDFRVWAAQQWRNHWPAWLAASVSEGGDVPERWLPLHPPPERAMVGDPDAVAAWVQEWQRFAGTDGVQVRWVERVWRAHGVQRLPERASGTPAALAGLAGHGDTWQRASDAAARVADAWPGVDLTQAVGASARKLGALAEPEVVRLLAVLGWLAAHPDSGLWERELPVPDVHTKWVEHHRALVEPLLTAITGRDGSGLRRTEVRFRVRVLDVAVAVGADDFSVDLPGLQRLPVAPATVLICENATTLGTLPPLPSTVAVHGMGFAAPALAEVAWVRHANVWYWGDLDTYGFQILGLFRAALPEARSVLMDAASWRAHERLCVDEPRPFRGEIGFLTSAELEALALVRAGDRRLEQERIPREAARAALARLSNDRPSRPASLDSVGCPR